MLYRAPAAASRCFTRCYTHAASARTTWRPSQRARQWRTAAAGPAPNLDAELEKQLNEILKEIDPEGLVDDAEELALLEAAEAARAERASSGAAATTAGAAPPAPGGPNAAGGRGGGRGRGRRRVAGPEPPAAAQAAEDDDSTVVQLEGLPEGVTLTLGEQRRKGAVLIELLRAGADIEAALAKFRHEIDDVLVALMRRRLETAVEVEEEAEAVAAYRTVYALLNRDRQRAAASPALRLLDDVMAALGDDPGAPDYPERRGRAAAMMRDAFTGGALPVDVFTAAEALARDGPLAAEALSIEAVSPVAFLAEASELLKDSKRQQAELQEVLAGFQAELRWAQQHKPELLRRPDVAARVRQMAEAEAQLEPRQEAISQLEDVIKIAASLDLGAP